MMPNRGRQQSDQFQVLFDPAEPEAKLFDGFAEEQAKALPRINSSQLRRFFGEIKDLYRQYESLGAGKDNDEQARIYAKRIEPRFKMIRSKVSYATRAGGQGKVPQEFGTFLSEGIGKVNNADEFRKFVMHLEAVVGFMYGNGKVN